MGEANETEKPTEGPGSEPVHSYTAPSADKRWEVKGAIAAAAITAVVGGITIAVAVIDHKGGEPAPSAVATPSTAIPAAVSPPSSPVAPPGANGQPGASSVMASTSTPPALVHLAGSITGVAPTPKGLSVSGQVDPGIRSVVVFIRPGKGHNPLDDSLYPISGAFAEQAAVGPDGTFQLEVLTPTKPLDPPYVVSAYFNAEELSVVVDNLRPVGNTSCVPDPISCLNPVGPPALYVAK
jgi:hypothetical protein